MLKMRLPSAISTLQLVWHCPRSITSSSANDYQKPSTIDVSELEKFSKNAHLWWDLKGANKTLHSFNDIRVPFIVGDLMNNAESQSVKNTRVLDVGCGGGLLSEALAKTGVKVTGIDPSEDLVHVAVQHCSSNQDLKTKPVYICTTIEEHANEYNDYYDRIVASEVIEHVNNKELFVSSCVKVLKPGGKIFFTCPSKTRLSQLVNIWFAEYVINNPPKGTHQYDKLITPRDLELMLESNRCHVEEVKGFALNMFTSTWKWTRTKSLFFAMFALKLK